MTSRGSPELGVKARNARRALDGLGRAAWGEAERAGRLDLVELVGRVCAAQLGLEPLRRPPGSGAGRWADTPGDRWRALDGLTDRDRALLELAEQFTVDVSAVTDGQRSALMAQWGSDAATMTAVVFAMDFLPRSWAALSVLDADHPAGPQDGDPPGDSGGIWAAMDRIIRTVPQLDDVDPVTSELIRLRGARQHRCRLCQSLRSRPALLAGGGELLFDEVDDYEASGSLSPHQKAALAVTDAMVWTPRRIGTALARLTATSTPAQCVEVVVDVTRNALNKVAVALGADAPHVDDGLEIYDIGADGELVYGLTLE